MAELTGASPSADAPPRLVARGVGKSFGEARVLEGVSLELRGGSVHAMLGENGAGKSTLMKILAGVERPSTGTLELDGVAYAPLGPVDARRRGVAIVHQELSLCPHLTVAENIVLGVEPRRAGLFSRADAVTRARRALALVEEKSRQISPLALVSGLSAAEQQLVEIARARSADDCRLLILDEPTTSLGHDDAERLFQVLDALRGRGLTILYVSHFLDEIRRIADDFTVLRDGKLVTSGLIADSTNEELVAAMAGEAVQHRAPATRPRGEVILSLQGVAGARLPRDASLELHRGEVLGIAGLMGSGRTELLRAVFGLDRVKRGEIRVAAALGPASPLKRLGQGVGLVSEDRAHEGLALELSIAENLTLSKLSPLGRFGFLSLGREREVVTGFIERLGIRARGPDQRLRELSGGNQQKVALGRLLYHDVDVLLLDEPTRGIDVRSRAELHELFGELAARGKALLVVSSHFDELLTVCDRIAVMHKGVLGAPEPALGRSERQLLKAAAGA
ncbi:MAG TPA: sugar ABC transporter ATP-binding protein [Polyangiaceae bacterium]|nr:sugar ABC transporter ATP-binding protein [Polyangiaceae bacterium]